MSAPDRELLFPLRRFRPATSAEFELVLPDAMPEKSKGLLVHEGDMTSRLESFHKSVISLKVLQSEQGTDGLYFREVLLLNAGSGAVVEYGAIEIFLEAFSPGLRTSILEGQVPLGGLLNSHGLRYRSAPQAYFRVCGEEALAGLLNVDSETCLYGRCNELRTESGDLLARIVEVLPPIAPVAVEAV